MMKRPFRLGTTSFIFPDHITPNVRKTGKFFDEIELLVFESQPEDVLPSEADVRVLEGLGRDLDLGYNVHLPVDVSLTVESPLGRQQAADTLKRVLDRFAPLAPSTCTLHLDMDRHLHGPDAFSAWEEQARKGLALLVPGLDDPGLISVETLWYDPAILLSLVRAFGLSLCADLGHHFKYGYDPDQTFDRFREEISILHLHGVDLTGDTPRDHIGLDRLPDPDFDLVFGLLSRFTGTVSIEVFNYSSLEASLKRLAGVFSDIPVVEKKA